MATAQVLKKKLRGIQSIQKVSKALKTASTVKFSRLSTVCGNYAVYAGRCRRLYQDNRALFEQAFVPANPEAPRCFVVMAGNKGMCGSFNTDLLAFAAEQLRAEPACRVLLCGNQAKKRFTEAGLPYDRAFVFDDVPLYADAEVLFGAVGEMLRAGEISGVELIYPQYQNMMKQTPVRTTLTGGPSAADEDTLPLFFPDRESVVRGMADNVMTAVLFEKLLECALGAQAATLMAMRSAYDTAQEYSQRLEREINQKRQSRVTADVLETSSEFSKEVN